MVGQMVFAALLLGVSTQASAKWISLESNTALRAPVTKSVVSTVNGYRIQVRATGFDYSAKDVNGRAFANLNLNQEKNVLQIKGQPQVPVIRQLVALPTGSATLKVTSGFRKTVSLNQIGVAEQIAPAQESAAKVAGSQSAFSLDDKVYGQDALFPQVQARIAYQGSIRGHQVAMIEIVPYQYNPVRGELTYSPDLSVEVAHQQSLQRLPEKAALTSADLNNGIVGFTANEVAQQESLLMIVGTGFESHAKISELVESKTKLGFNVIVKNVSEMGATAPEVRTAIQSIYQESLQTNPLVYVLILGDVEKVPSYNKNYQHTNNYYAVVDKPTYEEDRTFPDLAVGRLTVSTDEELAVVVDKIIKYDHRNFTDMAWTKKMAFLATDDKWTVAEGTHNYVIDTYTSSLGISGDFPAIAQKGGDKIYAITHKATGADVMKAANDGRVLISYSGHGVEHGWDAPRMDQSDIADVKHPEALPYVMSHACLTGSYGNSTDGFAEAWLKAPQGAIAFWGTSNLSYWDEDDILEKVFFDGVYKMGIKTLGQMNLYGLQGVRNAYSNGGKTAYYYEIYNLMGDPSIQLIH